MADLSNYLENAIIDFFFRGNPGSSVTAPGTVYVSLWTAVSDAEAGSGTEVSAGGYSRVAVTFGAPSNGVTTNSGDVEFGPASANWGTVTHFCIHTHVSAGNALCALKALPASRTIQDGDTATFAAGDLSVTIA